MLQNEEGLSSQGGELSEAVARRLLWLLATALVLLCIGLSTPMITISQFIFIRNSFSVLSGIYDLIDRGQILLFLVVALFSVVLPLVKLWLLYQILSKRRLASPDIRRYLHLMHDYGRWSMLDVLVVAMLIVMVKVGAIASIEVHFGLYVFGAAVLLIMYLTHRVVALTTRG